ncbi:MAG: YeeE/YedE family protein [Wenzhouxiangella sp.]|nr:YeeE/YedE family protein [Wenzhouxiangella sp.]MCH8476537.1 YeeE/YedE family protein [Wenzhouxiangella sp.]TVR98000.1 MAG: YeeE/YedE family protein [Wenzhouxiangellaceae bacterium]
MLLLRHLLALAILATLIWMGFQLHESLGRQTSFVLICGAAFGFVLQRSRFCFFCILREWMEEGDASGVLGIIAALIVGTLGYLILFGAWVPDPTAGFLPPRAHIGPVSWVVVLGGLCFGIGMSLSGSCLSAHLYRLGEGSWASLFALAGAVAGFMLGFAVWNRLWSPTLADAEAIWLPASLGYAGAGALQLMVLGVLGVWLLSRVRPSAASLVSADNSLAGLWRRVMVERWPSWVGGLSVGLIGTAMYLRADPLGVTAELSRHSRDLGTALGLVPERLEGLDRLAGCIVSETAQRIGNNGIFVLAMIAAALAAALLAQQFRLERKPLRTLVSASLGGVLLGFGSMIALGCSVGTLLSGISALAVSGWLFALAMVAGVWISLPVRRKILAS